MAQSLAVWLDNQIRKIRLQTSNPIVEPILPQTISNVNTFFRFL